jgi:hypothetical protein
MQSVVTAKRSQGDTKDLHAICAISNVRFRPKRTLAIAMLEISRSSGHAAILMHINARV